MAIKERVALRKKFLSVETQQISSSIKIGPRAFSSDNPES